MLDTFPDKPKGMRWRTYDRLRNAYNAAEPRTTMGLMRVVDRLQGQFRLRRQGFGK
jgi:hypothetical protein